MPITRRQFNQAAAAALATTACAGPLTRRLMAQAPSPVQWRRISDKARVIEGLGGNALVFTDGDDTLLVDTKIAIAGALTRGFIETGGYHITQVVNTHHHADHTGGNAVWTPDTPILAHELAKPRISAQHDQYKKTLQRRDPDAEIPPAEQYAPTQTIPGDSELTIGGHTIELRHYGPGHTDNDLVLLIPKENILHTGDLLFCKMHVYIDLDGGASTKGWLANVEELIKLCDADTTVIPGHGPVTSVRGLEQQRDYLRTLRETVAEAVKSGKSREETYKLPIPGYEDYESARGQAMALNAAYIELTGKAD
jgi:glyoxylase-like metal-dependent hydrolase (beta-lactamase superfamily II)